MASIVERIGKLLTQAERASTEEEAAAFYQKAQALATTNAVDMAVAKQTVQNREKRETPVQRSIYFGSDQATKNTKKHLVELFSAVAGPNDVKLNIYHASTGVIAFGFPSDIEVVELLFSSLAVQMIEAGNAYIKSGEYKTETVYRSKRVPNPHYDGYWGESKTIEEWGHFPVDGRTARHSFYQGFISRVGSRLWDARREALAKLEEVQVDVVADERTPGESVDDFIDRINNPDDAPQTATTTGALVLADRGLEVRDFYKENSKARGSWKGSSSSGHSSSGYAAGRTAGSNARLTSQRSIAS